MALSPDGWLAVTAGRDSMLSDYVYINDAGTKELPTQLDVRLEQSFVIS